MLFGIIGPVFVIIIALIIVSGSIKILREYERAVVFTLGHFSHVKGPGLVILVPFIQQIVRVDLRTVVMEIPSQDLISRDNVSVKVDAVLYFHVVDPEKSVIQVEQFISATNLLAQTTLRSVLRQHDLDEMLGSAGQTQHRCPRHPRHAHQGVGHRSDGGRNPRRCADRQHGQSDREAGGSRT